MKGKDLEEVLLEEKLEAKVSDYAQKHNLLASKCEELDFELRYTLGVAKKAKSRCTRAVKMLIAKNRKQVKRLEWPQWCRCFIVFFGTC